MTETSGRTSVPPKSGLGETTQLVFGDESVCFEREQKLDTLLAQCGANINIL